MSRLTLCIAAISLAGCASTSGWRALRVDGSSKEGFEESVASLQRELPYYRNQHFTQALAAIWITDVSDEGGDLDCDGDVDEDDAGMMLDFVFALRDGAPVLPIDDSAESDGDYTARDFYRQFDGLGYEEIVGLADPSIMQRYSKYLAGRGQATAARVDRIHQSIEPYFPPPPSPQDLPPAPSR